MTLFDIKVPNHIMLWLGLIIFWAIREVYGKAPGENGKLMRNCPPEFTYGELRRLVLEGSLVEAQKLLDSLGATENKILYGMIEVGLDIDIHRLKIELPDLELADIKVSSKIREFISYEYVFDCKDIKESTRFLFWILRHFDLNYLSAVVTFSITKYVFSKAVKMYGEEHFKPDTPVTSINWSEIVAQSSKDDFPSRKQINEAIRKFTSTGRFSEYKGVIDLPDLSSVTPTSIEDKVLRNRVLILQRGGYAPKNKDRSQIQTVKYIMRTSRYYLNIYLSAEISYRLWSIVYFIMMGIRISEYKYRMFSFIMKKSQADTWPHESDVLEAISGTLTKFGIKHKPLSIHSRWYKRLKKEGYVLSVPQNTKTSRWFCRFFQHHLQIMINPYLQFNIWKTTLENLLEPHIRQVNVSGDKCFIKEDPKFPWPNCSQVPINSPEYDVLKHDKAVDNLTHEFARIIHNFNPGYPFHDLCELTRQLIETGSFRRKVRQPITRLKHEIAIRKLERKTYIRNLVRSYNYAKKYEPFIKPSDEMIFFFKDYIENDVPLNDKIADKIAREKFMDEDLEDVVKTRNFVIDCAKTYSSITARKSWNDIEIKEIPAKGKKAISTACSNLFYSRPKCKFESIPPFHPAREHSDILTGEFSLRIFSFFRGIGVFNTIPDDFCPDAINVMSKIFKIKPKNHEQLKRDYAKNSRIHERDRFIRNALLRFKTLDNTEKQRSRTRKLNEMMEQIVKSKLQDKLKPKMYDYIFSTIANRYSEFVSKADGNEWEIDELKDMVRLGKKFVYYNSFKQFPKKKFKQVCNKFLTNIVLKIQGSETIIERMRNSDPSLKLSDQRITRDITKNLCFSLGSWQISLRKRIENKLEFLWLKMNNHRREYRLIDSSLIPVTKYASQKYYMQTADVNVINFYNSLSTNLKHQFPQLDIKLPNTIPIEPEVMKLRKLGYDCPPPKSVKSDGIPTAEECIRYLYRYGLYIYNGLILDFQVLYKVYQKSFMDSGFESLAYLPNIYPKFLNFSLKKSSVFDYNFHRFETICSINKLENDIYWNQYFTVVENISKDLIIQLHSANIVLPGSADRTSGDYKKIPLKTKSRTICEFVARVLNPNFYKSFDVNTSDFFKGEISNAEYNKGIVWYNLNQANSGTTQHAPDNIDKNVMRSLYTIYFIQSCIHSLMKYFPGIHFLHAALLCRKTREWRSCDETQFIGYNYIEDLEVGEPIEEIYLNRLMKGVFIDMVTFEIQEKSTSLFWASKLYDMPTDRLPISYMRFCPVSLRIHDYLQSGRFKNFVDACVFALETSNVFRVEINGEMFTIKRSLAEKLCSSTFWGQDCNHPTIKTSAKFLYESLIKTLKLPSQVVPSSIMCNVAYEMAFSSDPVNICFNPNTFEDTRPKAGTNPYSEDYQPRHKTHDKEARPRTKKWDTPQMNFEEAVPLQEDPMGMLGHIAKTYSLGKVSLSELREACEQALVSIRDCSKVPSFVREHPTLARDPETLKKINEETMRLFYPLVKKNNPRNFEELPVRIATFVELCNLSVSTYNISPELFNTACVSSFGWNKYFNSNQEIWKDIDWQSSILYCSSTSKWKNCSRWSKKSRFELNDDRIFELSSSYANSTPLQKASVDFMAAFFSSTISLFLSGANTQSITEDPKDLGMITKLRENYGMFCPAATELLMNHKLIDKSKLKPSIIEFMRSQEISYSEVRRYKPSYGIPYLFFNADCPEVLTNHILNIVKSTQDSNKSNAVPLQWSRKEFILEFAVRVCKKHFSWKDCNYNKDILSNYNPLEINQFEYVASSMYREFLVSHIEDREAIPKRSHDQKNDDFYIFCKLSINVISERPRIINSNLVRSLINDLLPKKFKNYSQNIANAFFSSFESFHKGVKYIKSIQSPKETTKFSFS
ncbi:large secreted protein [Cryptosporidium sp. chipmunk genotype I]|uniref:large secreted protein n=1 Tax=Cryptosporidium sp. chipmunk genotype I TaxID=1280935 RepID=UPI00351A09E9|nr:large secreted protein [Cryptosporidium sp. chipmunk genotype I]